MFDRHRSIIQYTRLETVVFTAKSAGKHLLSPTECHWKACSVLTLFGTYEYDNRGSLINNSKTALPFKNSEKTHQEKAPLGMCSRLLIDWQERTCMPYAVAPIQQVAYSLRTDPFSVLGENDALSEKNRNSLSKDSIISWIRVKAPSRLVKISRVEVTKTRCYILDKNIGWTWRYILEQLHRKFW